MLGLAWVVKLKGETKWGASFLSNLQNLKAKLVIYLHKASISGNLQPSVLWWGILDNLEIYAYYANHIPNCHGPEPYHRLYIKFCFCFGELRHNLRDGYYFPLLYGYLFSDLFEVLQCYHIYRDMDSFDWFTPGSSELLNQNY